MGYSVQEITSGPLSSVYSSYYKELQVRNWTPYGIVITELDGSQTIVSASNGPNTSETVAVEISCRYCNGQRAEITRQGAKEKQIKGHQILVPYQDIIAKPQFIHEHNFVISTPDQSMLAKHMVSENRYQMVRETAVDEEILDPRFVLKVNDPCNQWDMLLVNIMGQTVVLRAGAYSQVLPTAYDVTKLQGKPSLTCYLRYPYDYYTGAKPAETVFDIELGSDIVDKSPVVLANGDVICIASSDETMRQLLAKRNSGRVTQSVDITSKMIPKEVYDAEIAAAKAELERVKQDDKTKLETLTLNKNNEIAELKSKIGDLSRKNQELEVQLTQWKNIHGANQDARIKEEKFFESRESARKEANEAAKSNVETTATVVKVGLGIAAAVISFAIGMAVQANKKK